LEKKFRKIIQAIARKYKIDHDEAGHYFAGRLACLNLLPYHSRSRPSLRRLKDLPSVQAMLDFVPSANLVERAKDGKALVVVVRGKKYWQKALDLEGHKGNVVVYNPKTRHVMPLLAWIAQEEKQSYDIRVYRSNFSISVCFRIDCQASTTIPNRPKAPMNQSATLRADRQASLLNSFQLKKHDIANIAK
jgi:hypothetical protein